MEFVCCNLIKLKTSDRLSDSAITSYYQYSDIVYSPQWMQYLCSFNVYRGFRMFYHIKKRHSLLSQSRG